MRPRQTFFVGLCLCVGVYIIISEYSKKDHVVNDSNGYTINKFNEPKMQACVHPNLSLWKNDFDIKSIKNRNVTCGDAEKEWVYTGNGKFYISSKAVKQHGKITCTYIPIRNSKDSYNISNYIYNMRNNSLLPTDIFKVKCLSASGKKYNNFHAGISIDTNSKNSQNKASYKDKFNIMILLLDSVSRHMFKRLLPNTHQYLTQVLGGSVLEGYNIIAEGTTNNLMPIFTGKLLSQVPEVRRLGIPGVKHVDEVLNFVWKEYENKSYVTQWAEDAEKGVFSYRVKGFSKQPVTHYMRPFYLLSNKAMQKDCCIGERSSYKVILDWFKEGLETNKGKPFFTFGVMGKYTHDEYLQMPKIDKYNVDFIKYLNHKRILKNTFLIVMSDHGHRFSKFRLTEQGKMEERLPYFGIYIPPTFRGRFPEKFDTFMENTKRLTTPLDIHETLLDIIGVKGNHANSNIPRYSLFTHIPLERTCTDAGIESHWCACLESETISVIDQRVVRGVHHVLAHINNKLKPFVSLCHQLSLKNISKAFLFKTNANVLKFKRMIEYNIQADFSHKLKAHVLHFQVTFETKPHAAIFEASFIMDTKTLGFKINENTISRINKYGDAPKCIENVRPDLMPFCYCR